MSIRKNDSFSVICDHCLETLETAHEGFSIFVDEQFAQEEIDNADWFTEEGRDDSPDMHYCDKCHYFDDEDVMHLREERKKEPPQSPSIPPLTGEREKENPFGLSNVDVKTLLDHTLKPEEISGEASIQHERIKELMHWFIRFCHGGANGKWFQAHAFELAYYIATKGSNSVAPSPQTERQSKSNDKLVWNIIEYFQTMRYADDECMDREDWSDKVLSYNEVEVELYTFLSDTSPSPQTEGEADRLSYSYLRSEADQQIPRMQALGVNTDDQMFEQCVNSLLMMLESRQEKTEGEQVPEEISKEIWAEAFDYATNRPPENTTHLRQDGYVAGAVAMYWKTARDENHPVRKSFVEFAYECMDQRNEARKEIAALQSQLSEAQYDRDVYMEWFKKSQKEVADLTEQLQILQRGLNS